MRKDVFMLQLVTCLWQGRAGSWNLAAWSYQLEDDSSASIQDTYKCSPPHTHILNEILAVFQEHYCMYYIIMRCMWNIIGRFQFGSFNPNRQTAKFNSPSNFPAIRYKITNPKRGNLSNQHRTPFWFQLSKIEKFHCITLLSVLT